jgi:hypothetical protein
MQSTPRCRLEEVLNRRPHCRGLPQNTKKLKIAGTNSISPLGSTKVAKNELKTNWFLSAKTPIKAKKHVLGASFRGSTTCLTLKEVTQLNNSKNERTNRECL